MDLQKVKEALEAAKAELPELSSAPNGKEPKAIRAARLVAEAIAELEKPADDDAGLCAESCIAVWLSESTDRRNDTAKIIQQYTKQYHTKKCTECVGQLPAFPHKKQYFPLGQEPVNQQCLSCRLNCPNDCPLDKQKDL